MSMTKPVTFRPSDHLVEGGGITLLLIHQNTHQFVDSGQAPPVIFQQETRIENFIPFFLSKTQACYARNRHPP